MSLQVVEKKKIVLFGSQGDPILILIEPGLQNGKPARQEEKFKNWYAKKALFKNCLYTQACSILMDYFNLDLRYCLNCPIYSQENSGQPFLTGKDEQKLNSMSMNNLGFIKSLAEQGSLRFLSEIESPEILASLNQSKSSTSKPSAPVRENKAGETSSDNSEKLTAETKKEEPKKGRGRGLSLFLLKYPDSAGDIQEERVKMKKLKACELAQKRAQELEVELKLWVVKKIGPPEEINWQHYLRGKTLPSPKPKPKENFEPNTSDENSSSEKPSANQNNNHPEFIDLNLGEIIGEVDFIFSPQDLKKIIQLSQKNPQAKGVKITVNITWEELGDFKGEISSLP